MKITIAKNEKEFDQMAAWRIITQMLVKPEAVIGLSTGQTTMNMHRIVSEIYQTNPFPTSLVKIFNVDELTNLPRTYSGSCYAMIKSQLCDNLNIPEDNFIMPPTFSEDFEQECKEFETAIAMAGGADLQMLGIGWNGHIGINQPGTPFDSTTWVSPMDPIFEAKVRKETNVDENYSLGGLTLGIKNIMHTRKIVLIAKGKHKAEIIKKAVLGPITTDIPASVLQLHPNCEVLLDADAASML
ncbi:MAG: galactosamine-6-phosphate isomerase [Herbinix sp.]|jgi:glucosamine-6-phosphate deaminase|nr:galactosamine-6-phosphate isomerase [Herbinix sp.]